LKRSDFKESKLGFNDKMAILANNSPSKSPVSRAKTDTRARFNILGLNFDLAGQMRKVKFSKLPEIYD
jgi:hypothetical protein